MRRRCPNCSSLNVRRSSHERDDLAQPVLRSPYRCRDCQTTFWALSTKVYRRMILIIAVNVVFFAVMLAFLLARG
jgi:transposase-like protein